MRFRGGEISPLFGRSIAVDRRRSVAPSRSPTSLIVVTLSRPPNVTSSRPDHVIPFVISFDWKSVVSRFFSDLYRSDNHELHGIVELVDRLLDSVASSSLWGT